MLCMAASSFQTLSAVRSQRRHRRPVHKACQRQTTAARRRRNSCPRQMGVNLAMCGSAVAISACPDMRLAADYLVYVWRGQPAALQVQAHATVTSHNSRSKQWGRLSWWRRPHPNEREFSSLWDVFFFSHAFLRTVAAIPAQEAYQLRAGSRRREAACEQCGATADLSEDLAQVRRRTQPALAAARSGGGRLATRCRATASAPKRPPTSTPTTTRRSRRALASSGYVWRRLRQAAAWTAAPGRAAAPGCGSPTGLTMVASIASCAPCQGAGRSRRPQCNARR